MSVILILILASLVIALTFLVGFIWAVKSGQFEDTCTPGMRVLAEETAEGRRAPAGERKTNGTRPEGKSKSDLTVQVVGRSVPERRESARGHPNASRLPHDGGPGRTALPEQLQSDEL